MRTGVKTFECFAFVPGYLEDFLTPDEPAALGPRINRVEERGAATQQEDDGPRTTHRFNASGASD
jgi:hypothetical protein